MTTVVIPAHNESKVIGRLLGQLVTAGPEEDYSVIVVANGCTDDTAAVASAFGPAVRVVSIGTASKHLALAAGDASAAGFPRIYVDADVELGPQDVRALVAELARPGVLAAAPRRAFLLDECPWPVRWYYDVWLRLPQVADALFGRGAIAVSEAGHRRIAALPPLLADDLAASLAFAPAERSIAASARVVSHPPRTLRDLVRRRIRVATGVAQIERSAAAPPSTARTRPADLLAIIRAAPALLPKMALFTTVTAVARLLARRAVARGDFSSWHRDDSSRAPAVPAPAVPAPAPAVPAQASRMPGGTGWPGAAGPRR